jgi:hypothetical protein
VSLAGFTLLVITACFGRAALLKKLNRMPGQQLVLVRYKPDHNTFEEWVYNARHRCGQGRLGA